jgi:uncharacterized protein YdaU (DUF1376 family)
MAKDPVLPLYYNDISTSTQDWSDEEFGAYMRLLIHQWRQGGLPKDYQRLTRIATSLERTWPLLQEKFKEVDGLLKNENMEDIRAKRAFHKQKQKENVEKRYQNSTKLSTKHPTKTLPLEREKEIEIEKDNVFKYEVKKEKEEPKKIILTARLPDVEDDMYDDYVRWVDDIIKGNDAMWEQLIMSEGVSVPVSMKEYGRTYLKLLAEYKNKRPNSQQKFRRAFLGHITENSSKKSNDQTKGTSRTISAQLNGKDYGAGL